MITILMNNKISTSIPNSQKTILTPQEYFFSKENILFLNKELVNKTNLKALSREEKQEVLKKLREENKELNKTKKDNPEDKKKWEENSKKIMIH